MSNEYEYLGLVAHSIRNDQRIAKENLKGYQNTTFVTFTNNGFLLLNTISILILYAFNSNFTFLKNFETIIFNIKKLMKEMPLNLILSLTYTNPDHKNKQLYLINNFKNKIIKNKIIILFFIKKSAF